MTPHGTLSRAPCHAPRLVPAVPFAALVGRNLARWNLLACCHAYGIKRGPGLTLVLLVPLMPPIPRCPNQKPQLCVFLIIRRYELLQIKQLCLCQRSEKPLDLPHLHIHYNS